MRIMASIARAAMAGSCFRISGAKDNVWSFASASVSASVEPSAMSASASAIPCFAADGEARAVNGDELAQFDRTAVLDRVVAIVDRPLDLPALLGRGFLDHALDSTAGPDIRPRARIDFIDDANQFLVAGQRPNCS